MIAQRERDVIVHAQFVDQPEILEHHANPPPQRGPGGAIQRRRIAVEQPQRTVRGLLGQADNVQQGGLARAGCAGHKTEIAGLQRQRDVVQQLGAAVIALSNMFEPDHHPPRDTGDPRRAGAQRESAVGGASASSPISRPPPVRAARSRWFPA